MPAPLQHYVSKELTHFVGKKLKGKEEEQYNLLLKIVSGGSLGLGTGLMLKRKAKLSQNEMYNPAVVCFCDIPVQYLAIHIAKYSHFGLSFGKDFVCRNGGCPVFYLPTLAKAHNDRVNERVDKDTKVQEWLRREHLDREATKGDYFDYMAQLHSDQRFELLDRQQGATGGSLDIERFWRLDRFLEFHIFSYTKFFDHTLPDEHEHNYYFEREWRLLGHMSFNINDIRRIIIPETYARRFREDCPEYCGQLTFAEYS